MSGIFEAISESILPSKRVLEHDLLYENEFYSQTHLNGFAPELVLKQRQNALGNSLYTSVPNETSLCEILII